MIGKYSAHHEVRQVLAWILWITATGAIGSFFSALRVLPSLQSWELLVLSFAWVAITIGIWHAQEWARWAAGLISSGYCVWAVQNLVHTVKPGDLGTAIVAMIPILYLGFLAVYSFLPSTRTRFAEAREAIARARAVPGGSAS